MHAFSISLGPHPAVSTILLLLQRPFPSSDAMFGTTAIATAIAMDIPCICMQNQHALLPVRSDSPGTYVCN